MNNSLSEGENVDNTDNSPGAEQKTLRVFHVEDSPGVRQLVADSLSEIPGVRIVGRSESEDDAFNQLEQQRCDIVIVDIQLKVGNGINLLRKLSEAAIQSESIKIIFSNNVSECYRSAGKKYGAGLFFDKTTEFLQLRDAVVQLRQKLH